jgi:hypothetical protein
MSNINNIKIALSNTLSAVTGTVAVSTKLVADGATLVSKGVAAAPEVTKEIVQLPFSTTQGYLEAEGLSEEDAKAIAYKYLEQDVATTVREAGKGGGKLLQAMLADPELDDNKANSSEENK